MKQLNHSEAAESFSSICNRSSISNLQIQCRYHIVVVSICQLMWIYCICITVLKNSIIHAFIIICQLNVTKKLSGTSFKDTFVEERATYWILQTHPVVAVVIFIIELTEESLQHPWWPARGQFGQLCQRLAKTERSHRG